MRKKIMFAVFSIITAAITIVGLSSFTSQSEKETTSETTIRTQVSCRGKHCTYTVGCDCSGFSPNTNGKEWKKSYCKRCGHHKKYHK